MTKEDVNDCAAVWFARLERARNLGDEKREAEALRELTRLGVQVEFTEDAQ